MHWLHLRGDGHQELVETPEEDVGTVTDPDVIRNTHEQQQAGLQARDGADDQRGPEVPADLNEARDEGGDRTCRRRQSRNISMWFSFDNYPTVEQIVLSGSFFPFYCSLWSAAFYNHWLLAARDLWVI